MNVIKFKSFKDKNLTFCFIDTTHSIIDPWIKEITKNQADYTLQNLYNKGYTVYQGVDEDELLKTASQEYDFACVISTGTEFINGDECFIALETECSDNFLIKGHILDRSDAYYELHQQCYLINLKKYRELNYPIIGKQSLGEKHLQLNPFRSRENIHDDYTPLWIRQGQQLKEYSHKCHGWHIIQESLKHYDIEAFRDNIRNNKKHLYPESAKDFYKQVSYVYNKERFCANSFVHTSHTEHYNKKISNLRQVIAPASGEWYKEMLDKNNPCKVILYDYNLQSLEYWKSNVEKLDNVTYHFLHWDLLGESVDLLSVIDLSLSNYTLINLSNIFCYEGTATLANTRYRLEKESNLLNYFKTNIPNAWINFSARASSGFIDENDYIQRAEDISIYSISDLKKPTWHVYDWI